TLNFVSKLLYRPVRLSSQPDPLEWHEEAGYRPRPRVPHHGEFKQPRKNIRWNYIGIVLQTKMFMTRVMTLDIKSINSVLQTAACEFVFTVARKNTLNRISTGPHDMYEEPILRYRNHPKPSSKWQVPSKQSKQLPSLTSQTGIARQSP